MSLLKSTFGEAIHWISLADLSFSFFLLPVLLSFQKYLSSNSPHQLKTLDLASKVFVCIQGQAGKQCIIYCSLYCILFDCRKLTLILRLPFLWLKAETAGLCHKICPPGLTQCPATWTVRGANLNGSAGTWSTNLVSGIFIWEECSSKWVS